MPPAPNSCGPLDKYGVEIAGTLNPSIAEIRQPYPNNQKNLDKSETKRKGPPKPMLHLRPKKRRSSTRGEILSARTDF